MDESGGRFDELISLKIYKNLGTGSYSEGSSIKLLQLVRPCYKALLASGSSFPPPTAYLPLRRRQGLKYMYTCIQ